MHSVFTPARDRLHRLLLSMGAVLILTGCQGDKLDANGFREDERALLQLTGENIKNLERNNQYREIYEQYASGYFKQHVQRRQFMGLARCAETHLGDILQYDRKNPEFKRQQGKRTYLDSITFSVNRSSGDTKETLAFIKEGLDYRLQSLSWDSPRKGFQDCIETIAKDIRNPAPLPQVIQPTPTPAPGESPEEDEDEADNDPDEPKAAKKSAEPKPQPKPAQVPAATTQPASGEEAPPVIHRLENSQPTPAPQPKTPLPDMTPPPAPPATGAPDAAH